MNLCYQFILLASIFAVIVVSDNDVQTVDVTCEYEDDDRETCTISRVDYRPNTPNNLNILNADATTDTIHFKMTKGRYNVMPLNLFQLFPKLEKLQMSTGLKAITKENLIGGNGLKKLLLSENKIRVIKAQTFDGMDKLTVIDLEDNMLKKVESHAFTGATNLKKLVLRSNLIDIIEDGAFNIPTLEEINLSSNSLETLADDVFVGCPDLKLVNLYENELTRIGKSIDSLSNFNHVLFMTNNVIITDFDFYAIARKPDLKIYIAESVALVLDDPASAANDDYTAEHLDISGNVLIYPDIFHRLRNFRNLTSLEMSNNNFTTIDDIENILKIFPKLQELEINGVPCKDEVFRRLHTKFGDKIKSKYTFES